MIREPATETTGPTKDFEPGGFSVSHQDLWKRRLGEERRVPPKTFWRQEDAWNHWETHGRVGNVYAMNLPPRPGRRANAVNFHVRTFRRQYRLVQATRVAERNFYEQCPVRGYNEGDCAVHMHVDMDLHTANNPDFPDAESYDRVEPYYLDTFIQYMARHVGVPREDVCVFVSDSTKVGRKISRHYVFRIKGHMFASNINCGALKRHFQHWVHRTYGAPDRPENIWYFRDAHNDGHEFFMDAIYTLSRNLRMMGNTKIGEVRLLRPVDCALEDLTSEQYAKYSIVLPDTPPADDATLRLIEVPEVGGGPAKSRRLTARHFMQPEPEVHRRIVHHNESQESAVMRMQNAEEKMLERLYVPDDWRAASERAGIRWVNNSGVWGVRKRMNGCTQKPVVCKTMGKMLVRHLLRTSGEVWRVDSGLGITYSDFTVSTLRFEYVTKGGTCGLLYELTKGARHRHGSQNSILMVDLRTREFWWECYSAKVCIGRRGTRHSFDTDAFRTVLKTPQERRLFEDIERVLRVFDADFTIDLAQVVRWVIE